MKIINGPIRDRCGVYAIRCLPTGMSYYGSSTNMGKRKKRHCKLLRKGINASVDMQSDFNKYGIENFIFEVVERFDQKDKKLCEQRERYHITADPNHYNKRHSKSVYCFDLDGKLLKVFNSATDAAIHLNAKSATFLSSYCRKGYVYHKKYRLSYTDTPVTYIPRSTRKRYLEMYDLDGVFVKRFTTMTEGCKYFKSNNVNRLSNKLRGNRYWNNHLWKWSDDQLDMRNQSHYIKQLRETYPGW